jgi:hypothetical protein
LSPLQTPALAFRLPLPLSLAHLASLEGGDLAEASDAALAMALEVDAAPTDG